MIIVTGWAILSVLLNQRLFKDESLYHMTGNEAIQKIEEYRNRYYRVDPNGEHLLMIQLASFPVALTVHLLYQLWVNFKHLAVNKQGIPVLTVNDCILSNLFIPTGKDMYEMDGTVREQLKLQFKNKYSAGHVKEVVSFLYTYSQNNTRGSIWQNFYDAQEQAAIMELNPELAARQVLQALAAEMDKKKESGTANMQRGIGISNLISTLSKDNKAFAKVVEDSLTNSNTLPFPTENTNGKKTLIITDKKTAYAASVKIQDLPFAISERLKPFYENKFIPAPALETINATTGNVYALMVGISNYADKKLKSPEAANDVRKLKKCLEKKGLLKGKNGTMLLNKAATKSAIQQWILRLMQEAQTGDTVLIYLSGRGSTSDKRFLLVDFDETSEYTPQEEDYIQDREFGSWLLDSRNNPNVVVIIDSCCSSKDWIGGIPGHLALLSSWPGEKSFERPGKGGYFTSSLVEVLNENPVLSYKNLYNRIIIKMQALQQDQHAVWQFAMFQVNEEKWHNLFLSNQPAPVSTLALQRLLMQVGYKVTVDGISGPATQSILKNIRTEVQAREDESDEDLLNKIGLMRSFQPWNILWLKGLKDPISSEVRNLLEQKSKQFHFKYSIRNTRKLIEFAEERSALGNNIQEYTPLFDCQLLLIGLTAEELANEILVREAEKHVMYAFAMNKSVFIIRYDTFSFSNILSQFIVSPTNGMDIKTKEGINCFRDDLDNYIKNLERYIRNNPRENTALSNEQKIMAAQRSGVLDLSNQNLKRIPTEIFELKGLKELNLAGNKLTEIPSAFEALKSLQTLDISNNDFKEGFPFVLYKLRQLRKLNVSHNFGPYGDYWIDLFKLNRLEELDVSQTGIWVLDPLVVSSPSLKLFLYGANPMINLPSPLNKGESDITELRSYFKSIEANISAERFAFIEIISGSSSENTQDLEHYIIIDSIDTTDKLFATISSNYTPNTIFIINSEKYLDGFGGHDYDHKIVDQFFRVFHLSLNLIINNPSFNDAPTWLNLVNKRAINFAAVRNDTEGNVKQFVYNLYQQIMEQNTSLKNILQSLNDKNLNDSDISNMPDETNLFDYYFNAQYLNELKQQSSSKFGNIRSNASTTLKPTKRKVVPTKAVIKKSEAKKPATPVIAKKIATTCRCKQKSNGKFYCFRLMHGRWVQVSGIPFPTKEVCEASLCEENVPKQNKTSSENDSINPLKKDVKKATIKKVAAPKKKTEVKKKRVSKKLSRVKTDVKQMRKMK